MTERPPGLNDALELVAAIESQCRQLRQVDDDKTETIVAELERLLSEIRDELSPRRLS